MKRNTVNYIITGGLFLLFLIFTLLVAFVDVLPIGPMDSEVGFAALNKAVQSVIAQNELFYNISEYTIYLAILVAGGFAVYGLVSFIKKKNLLAVEAEVLLLGAIYVLAIAFYVGFEIVVINYRPVLIEGELEAAYPSSHTMLVSTILLTAAIAFRGMCKVRWARITVSAICGALTLFTVVTRLLSGVHWCTDIIGGVLLSAFLVMLYYTLIQRIKNK